MNRALRFALLIAAALMMVTVSQAQDPIESVCLVTDVGRVNDGTFNEFAYNGLLEAIEDFDLDDPQIIETQAETDYFDNIGACVENGADAVVTVGFLIQDATAEVALANPDIFFIGIDQDASGLAEPPTNYVGVQFREDQSGFLVGALAALVANEFESSTIAGVYGIDVPAVRRFRNGYEQGALYVNPEWEIGTNILGTYNNSFSDQALGVSNAEQFIGEGASVIFGAGGPLGSAAIAAAAGQGVYVIGVDQDEYLTTFGEGEVEGAEFLISSAIKRVDQGVYLMLAALAEGDFDAFPGGENFLLDAAVEGVGFAPQNDAESIPAEIYEELETILDALIAGDISTGVDPVSGDVMDMMDDMEEDMDEDMDDMEATEEAGD